MKKTRAPVQATRTTPYAFPNFGETGWAAVGNASRRPDEAWKSKPEITAAGVKLVLS